MKFFPFSRFLDEVQLVQRARHHTRPITLCENRTCTKNLRRQVPDCYWYWVQVYKFSVLFRSRINLISFTIWQLVHSLKIVIIFITLHMPSHKNILKRASILRVMQVQLNCLNRNERNEIINEIAWSFERLHSKLVFSDIGCRGLRSTRPGSVGFCIWWVASNLVSQYLIYEDT